MHDMQNRNVRRVFAFVEFFPTVEREYPKFLEVSPRVLTAMHSVADRAYPHPEPYQRVILNLSMLAGISFAEVVTLVGSGLGHGAMRILRSLLETAINVEFFRLRPSAFEDYKEWIHVERFKEIEYVRENAPDVYALLDEQEIADAKREMARVRPRFLARDRNGKSRGLRSVVIKPP